MDSVNICSDTSTPRIQYKTNNYRETTQPKMFNKWTISRGFGISHYGGW